MISTVEGTSSSKTKKEENEGNLNKPKEKISEDCLGYLKV